MLNSEEGGDLSDFITNGEWYLIGNLFYSLTNFSRYTKICPIQINLDVFNKFSEIMFQGLFRKFYCILKTHFEKVSRACTVPSIKLSMSTFRRPENVSRFISIRVFARVW